MPLGRLALSMVLALSVSLMACGGGPPDKEMQEAQQAIDRARAAGADKYAAEEYAAAVDALKESSTAVSQRDFRLALSHALDSRERADTAMSEAASKMVAARVEAENALSSGRASLDRTTAKLKAAETGRAPGPALAAPRASIATADQRLQEARKAFDQGDYIAANTATIAAMQALSAAESALDAAAAAGGRRRR